MKYVVTGSSSGLGNRLAQKLLNLGDVVGISRRNPENIIKERTNFSYHHIEADLSKDNTFSKNSKILSELKEQLLYDELTLVLNAGAFYSGTERLDSDARSKLFWVNLFSIMELIEQMKDLQLKRIFFINSISGLVGQPAQHEYASSKHALMGYIRSLIKEANNMPYDIMVINPGGINTELWTQYPWIDKNAFLCPEDLTEIIINLLTIKNRMFIPSFTVLPEIDL